MNIFNRLKLWIKVKRLFYRYNLKQQERKIETKTGEQILNEMASIYRRLPNEEQIIMRNKIQSIINTYRKE